jgi:hypothetical protein
MFLQKKREGPLEPSLWLYSQRLVAVGLEGKLSYCPELELEAVAVSGALGTLR